MKYKFEKGLKSIIISMKKGINEEEINTYTRLIDDLGFSSIEIITMIVKIEQAFKIQIEEEDLLFDKISVYGKLVEVISNCVSKIIKA